MSKAQILIHRYFDAAWNQGRKGIGYSDTQLPEHKELILYVFDLEQRLAEAEAKLPKWIPVEERLPKQGATVLAVDNSGDMGVCNFVNAKFIGECFGFEAYLNDGGWDCSASKVIGECVTHWMPLPDAPETERKGK